MTELITLAVMVAIGGMIGYSTNKVAVKMLFRPHKPVKLGLFTLQGVLPKRKAALATSVGETIEHALLDSDDIYDALLSENTRAKFKTMLQETLAKKIKHFIPSLFRTMLGDDLDGMIQAFVDKEGDHVIDKIVEQIKEASKDELSIQAIVEEKILALDLDEFESMVKALVHRELKHIEWIGLILGAIIGVFQFLITWLVL